MPGAVPAGIVSLKITMASPPAGTLVGAGIWIDQAPAPEVGIARLPSDGWPPDMANVTFTLGVPGAACRTNFCDWVVDAVTAPICHVPWKSCGPVPAFTPLPEP